MFLLERGPLASSCNSARRISDPGLPLRGLDAPVCKPVPDTLGLPVTLGLCSRPIGVLDRDCTEGLPGTAVASDFGRNFSDEDLILLLGGALSKSFVLCSDLRASSISRLSFRREVMDGDTATLDLIVSFEKTAPHFCSRSVDGE